MNHAKSKYRGNMAFLYILPGLIGFVLFYIWPFFYSLSYAFVDRTVGGSFVWFENFISLLGNKAYQLGLKNTLIFIGLSVPINMVLSLAAALLINPLKKSKALITLIFLIPLVIPSGSMAFFWKSFFAMDGYLNSVLSTFGIRVDWLGSEAARFVIILIFVWKNLGYNMVLFLAGLNNIPKEYYEAARVEGAGRTACLFRITMVYLLPTIVLVTTMSIINSFKVFKEIYIITGNYPHESIYTLQHFMNNMFSSLNYQKLTTATSYLVLIIAVVTMTLLKLERRAAQ